MSGAVTVFWLRKTVRMAINTKPTPGQIKKHPREFALYCQAIHGKGELDIKVCACHRSHLSVSFLIHSSFACSNRYVHASM